MTLREAAEPSLHEQVAVLLADRDRLQRERDEWQRQVIAMQDHAARQVTRFATTLHERDAALALVTKLREALQRLHDAADAVAVHDDVRDEARLDFYAARNEAEAWLAAEEPR